MSATESTDDREPPEFNFRRWLKQVAALIAAIAAVVAALLYFHPRQPMTEAQRQDLLKILCSGQTLRPSSDVEGCPPPDSQRGPPRRSSGSGRDVAPRPE